MKNLAEYKDRILFGTPFKVVFFIYVLLLTNNITAGRKVISLVLDISLALGFIVFIYRLIHYKRFIKVKNIFILLLFCISYIISMILNVKYGIMNNFKLLILMSLQFFILYVCDTDVSPEKYKKEFKLICNIFIVYTFICSFISFIELLRNYSYIGISSKIQILAGFIWGRLWGVYLDPNYGSVLCCVSIVLSLYFIIKRKNLFIKLLNLVNVIFEFAYVVFSDSRTGLISLVICIGLFTYMISFVSISEKNKLKKQSICILLLVFTSLASFYLPHVIKSGYNDLVRIESHAQNVPLKIEDKRLIGREADIKKDVSNRRFDIWKSGLEIYKTKPIFGVSFENIVPYALKNTPKTYIINNDSGHFDNMHNAFINILVAQGTVGFIIILYFIVVTIKFVFKYISKLSKKYIFYGILLLGCIVPIIISTMALSEIFYVYTPGSYLFWCLLGYLIHLLSWNNMTDRRVIE